MSIAQMNYLSILFYFMAGIFGALAAILYVAFDIRYIWKALRGNSIYRLKTNQSRIERIKTTEKLKRKEQMLQKQNKNSNTLPLQEQVWKKEIPHLQNATVPLHRKTESFQKSTIPLEEPRFSTENYTIPLESAHSTFLIENSTLPLRESRFPKESSTTPLQDRALLMESTSMNLIQNIVYIDSNEAISL